MATAKQQRRAGRLRRQLRDGQELSAREHKWLDEYNAKVKPRRPRVESPDGDDGEGRTVVDVVAETVAALASDSPPQAEPAAAPESAPSETTSDPSGEPSKGGDPPPIVLPVVEEDKPKPEPIGANTKAAAAQIAEGIGQALIVAAHEANEQGLWALSPDLITGVIQPAFARCIERYAPKDILDGEAADLAIVTGSSLFSFVQWKRAKTLKAKHGGLRAVPSVATSAGQAAAGAPSPEVSAKTPTPPPRQPPRVATVTRIDSDDTSDVVDHGAGPEVG